MLSFGRKPDEDTSLARYRVQSKADGTTSTVAVLDSQGAPRERRGRQAHRQPAARRPAVGRGALTPAVRFCSLGSGSSGNATVVEAAAARDHDAGS